MFRTIVVGTDGSRTAYHAVRKAAELARLCSARLHIVTGYRPPSDIAVVGPMGVAFGAGTEDHLRVEIEAMLQKLGDEIGADGVAVALHAVMARGADAILDVAEREGADAIVIGNRGMQGSRPSLGAVPFNVLQNARCAVVVVPTGSATGDIDSS